MRAFDNLQSSFGVDEEVWAIRFNVDSSIKTLRSSEYKRVFKPQTYARSCIKGYKRLIFAYVRGRSIFYA